MLSDLTLQRVADEKLMWHNRQDSGFCPSVDLAVKSSIQHIMLGKIASVKILTGVMAYMLRYFLADQPV